MARPIIDFQGVKKLDRQFARDLQRAVDTLEEIGGFEQLDMRASAVIRIQVMDTERIETRHDRVDAGADSSLSHGPSKIEIGHRLFTNHTAAGARLLGKQCSVPQIMLHLLAHELFHLDESSRMAACGVSYHQSKSPFSTAVRPALPLHARQLLLSAADHYHPSNYSRRVEKFTRTMPIEAVRAQDCASELCADLHGLVWLRKAELWTLNYQNALVSLRQEDEAKNAEGYQMSAELIALAGIQTRQEIVEATIDACVAHLAQGPQVDPDLQEKAMRAEPTKLSQATAVAPNEKYRDPRWYSGEAIVGAKKIGQRMRDAIKRPR